jgi:alpha-tubulin suppressor-like RCC1 family protein
LWVKIRVTGGGRHTLALKTDGTIWTWGDGEYGQLGLGFIGYGYYKSTPAQIGNNTDWLTVSAGWRHTAAIKTNYTIWTWGLNSSGQLGREGDTSIPVQVGTNSDWTAVASGGFHTIACKANGTLWAWGENSASQLGDGTQIDRYTPRQVFGVTLDWSNITAGYEHSLGLKTNGTIWSWGKNNVGQLGLGDTINRNIPTLIGE